MNEKVQLRKKTTMVEEEVKKLEEGVKRDFLDKKTVLIKWDARDYIDKLGDYHRELVNLIPSIGPHITKGVTASGAIQMVKCVMHVLKSKGVLFAGKVDGDRVKPYTGGATTSLAMGRIVLMLHVVERSVGL